MNSSCKLQYRQDIDGLRGIAVIFVIAFHAFPATLRGGFIGVDIFFVISGYLITSIIIKELLDQSFDPLVFYSRRIKRIFPALLIVLLSSLFVGWFSLLPIEYLELGKQVAASSVFLSNILFWHESGYFDSAVEVKPLLNLWSLGVEEQFYIIWPILLAGLWKLRMRLLPLILVISSLSFFVNIYLVNKNPIAGFYSPVARFWELLIGATLSAISISPLKFKTKSVHFFDANFRFCMGSTLIIFGLIFIDRNSPFPGWLALFPTLGSALIISAQNSIISKKMLGNPALVYIGLISYPLYLWHWPILSFLRIVEGGDPSISIKVCALFLSVILSIATYCLLELPLRKLHQEKIKVFALLTLMAIVGLFGLATYNFNGWGYRLPGLNAINAAIGEWAFPGAAKKEVISNQEYYVIESLGKKKTIYLGDSLMQQYLPRIEWIIGTQPQNASSAIFASIGGCIPIRDVVDLNPARDRGCDQLANNALSLAMNDPLIDKVVIAGVWTEYFHASMKRYIKVNGDLALIDYQNDAYKAALKKLSDDIKALTSAGKKVYFLQQSPAGLALDPKFMVTRSFTSFPNVLNISYPVLSKNTFLNSYEHVFRDLKVAAEVGGAYVISPIDYICENDFCPSVDGEGSPIYKDYLHLRPKFVRDHATFMDRTVVVDLIN